MANSVTPTLECTGKPYLLKAQHSAFNISDSTTIPLTVQNWQFTSFVPDSTNKHSTDKQRNFRVPDSTKSSKNLPVHCNVQAGSTIYTRIHHQTKFNVTIYEE